ncbi:hypothetical protein MMC16_005200 [Acarospora aff. strigata]|nr:hypothetical protein [Acarospora aff. strigata]
MAHNAATYSEGEDVAQLQREVSPLLVDGGGQWNLSASGKGLERQIQFKTFKRTWEFMDAVASKSAKERHHPEWSNIYNKVFIRWTTHSPSGLSSKDVRMAQFCNDQANTLGSLETSREVKLDELIKPLVEP